ncbi:MAG: lysine 2,3-aminomutase [Hyphomicrobium sp.]|nr:MAG: lysine 2,3-aminomutase [Hyphomicrobium sp.]
MTQPIRTLRAASELAAAGLIAPDQVARIAEVAGRYAVAITPDLAALIDRAEPHDPIARQFVPDVRELDTHPAERADPIGDHDKSPVRGIVHRYPDRVLLKVVGVCPVYCRFCFRRDMVGPDAGANLSDNELAAALDYIRSTPAVWEVILTGGDPFMLSPRRAGEVTAALTAIGHVGVIRWHTRVPVASPARVTDEFVTALRSGGKAVLVGVHVNHPLELTTAAQGAIARMVDGGIPVVSQTVLLCGVNNDAGTLEALMRALVAARVKPYYLHHGDLAPGTSHFRVPLAEGQAVMAELRRRLSGLAMPAYVLDIPGSHGKVPISDGHVQQTAPGHYRVRDAAGGIHVYQDHCAAPVGRKTEASE